MEKGKNALRRTLCATLRDVAGVKSDEPTGEAAIEKLGGKMKRVDFAVLISYCKAPPIRTAEACFLWRAGKLKKLSGDFSKAYHELIAEGYREFQSESRLVKTPIVLDFQLIVEGKSQEFQKETEFFASGEVYATILAKEE